MDSDDHFVICRNCGEQNFREDRYCWICHSPLYDNLSLQTPRSYRRKSQIHLPQSTFGAIEILMAGSVLLLTVGLVLSRLWGLAIVMWIVLLPAGLAIRVRSKKGIRRERPKTFWGILVHLSSSIMTAIAFLVVGVIVFVIALCALCLAVVSSAALINS